MIFKLKKFLAIGLFLSLVFGGSETLAAYYKRVVLSRSSYSYSSGASETNSIKSSISPTRNLDLNSIIDNYTQTANSSSASVSSASLADSSAIDVSLYNSTADLSRNQVIRGAFVLKSFSRVNIAVYDLVGNYIKSVYLNTSGLPAGTYYGSWDGTNSIGKKVPSGQYILKFMTKDVNWVDNGFVSERIDIINGDLAVPAIPSQPTTPTNPTVPVQPVETPGDIIESPVELNSDLGNKIEGAAANNYPVRSTAYAICFQSDKTAHANSIAIQWKSVNSYGGGNGGSYSYKLVTQNSNKTPNMSNVLASVTKNPGIMAGELVLPLSANLVSGEYYAIVVENIGSNKDSNYGSVNNLQTRVKTFDGIGGLAGYPSNGQWKAWVNAENPWGNGNHIWGTQSGNTPSWKINWSDGTATGLAYYWANYSGMVVSGNSQVAEVIYWNRPDKQIKQVGLSVTKMSGTLNFTLEEISGSQTRTLATGAMSSSAGSSRPEWAYSSTFSPITLQQGKTYRLWFSSNGQYKTLIPIADTGSWPGASYGGIESYVQTRTTGIWADRFYFENSSIAGYKGDLSFDLVAK